MATKEKLTGWAFAGAGSSLSGERSSPGERASRRRGVRGDYINRSGDWNEVCLEYGDRGDSVARDREH